MNYEKTLHRSTIGDNSLILSAGSISPKSFEERLLAAVAGGFDGIGMSNWEYGQLVEIGHTASSIRDEVASHGLRILELECVIGFDAPGEAACIPGVINTDSKEQDQFFEMADAFGARHLMAVGSLGETALRENTVEAFANLCDRAASHDLLVALEFIPATNIPDAAIAQSVIEQAGRSNGGICVDSWHHFRGTANDDLLKALKPEQVFVIQLSDGPQVPQNQDYLTDQNNRLAPGEGDFALAHLLEVLWEAGVQAPISVEVLADDLPSRAAIDVANLLGKSTTALIDAVRVLPKFKTL